jgi:hypothetical protein
MWIKKLPSEIGTTKQPEPSKDFVLPVILGILATLLTTFFGGTAFPGGALPNPDPLHELPFGLFLGILLGLYFYVSLNRKPKHVPKDMICPNCETVKRDDQIMECSCGGHFEDITTMKFVESPTSGQG